MDPKQIKKFFMKNAIGRKIIGFSLTIYLSMKKNKFCQIFYDEMWIHSFYDGTIAEVKPVLSFSSISQMVKESSDYWLRYYKPHKGDTIIDVGAGTGIDTLLFSKAVGSSGKVISIEAHPTTFLCLSKTRQYNNLQNVILCNCAITDKEGDVLIESSDNHIKNSILTQTGNIKVKGITLDRLLDQLKIGEVSLLKMNIEGAEKFAMHGMKSVLQKSKYVVIACHDFLSSSIGQEDMKTKDIVTDFLKTHGFTILANYDQRDYVRDHVHAINNGANYEN